MRLIESEEKIGRARVIRYAYYCNKCGKKIVNKDNEAFCFQLTFKKGKYTDNPKSVKVYTVDACKRHANQIMQYLKENGYRLIAEYEE